MKYLKILTLFSTFLLTVFILEANHTKANELTPLLNGDSKVKVSVTNDQTGETTYINTEDLNPISANSLVSPNNLKINSVTSNGESIDVGYEVFIPIESESTKTPGFSVMDTNSGSKTAGGVKATLKVNYNDRSTNKKYEIRLNSVSGNWSPTANMYTLSNRTVEAHPGAGTGKKLSKKPTSNSFSYNTGWGYNLFAKGDASPRAWSTAKVSVTGMTATYKIELEVLYP